MTDDEAPAEQWLPIAEAARAVGVPERTVWNWAKAKRVPTRKAESGLQVEVGAVRQMNESRGGTGTSLAERNASSAAGVTAANGSGGGSQRSTAGAMAARVFDALEHGATPVDIVRNE